MTLDVSGVFIMDFVGKVVFGWSLVFHLLDVGGLDGLDHSWSVVVSVLQFDGTGSSHTHQDGDELKFNIIVNDCVIIRQGLFLL